MNKPHNTIAKHDEETCKKHIPLVFQSNFFIQRLNE